MGCWRHVRRCRHHGLRAAVLPAARALQALPFHHYHKGHAAMISPYTDHTYDHSCQEVAEEFSKYKRHAQNFADKLQEMMRMLKQEDRAEGSDT